MKYIFLHGLGQAPSDWKATVKRLDFGRDIDCLIYPTGFQEKKPVI
mgnify:CR=1 FL=1